MPNKPTDSAKASREVKPIKTSGLSKDNNFLPNTFRQRRPERVQASPANDLANLLGFADKVTQTLQTSQRMNEEDERIRGAAASVRGDSKDTVVRTGLEGAIYGDAAADAWDDAASKKRANDVHGEIVHYWESNKNKGIPLSEMGAHISKMYAEAKAEGEAFGDRYVVGLGSVLQRSEDKMDGVIQEFGRKQVQEQADKVKYDELDATLSSFLENPAQEISTEESNKHLVNQLSQMSKSGVALGVPRDKYNSWVADAIYNRAMNSGDVSLLEIIKTKDKSGMSIFDRMSPELKSRHGAKVHQIEVKSERMAEQKKLEDAKAKKELEDNVFSETTGQLLEGQLKIIDATKENKTPEEISLLRKEQTEHLQSLREKYLNPEGVGYSQLDGPARVRMFNMIKQAEAGMYKTPDADTINEYTEDILMGNVITKEQFEKDLHKLGPQMAGKVKSYMDSLKTASGKNLTRMRQAHNERTSVALRTMVNPWKDPKDKDLPLATQKKNAANEKVVTRFLERYRLEMNNELFDKFEKGELTPTEEFEIRDKHLKNLKNEINDFKKKSDEKALADKEAIEIRKKENAERGAVINKIKSNEAELFGEEKILQELEKIPTEKRKVEALVASGDYNERTAKELVKTIEEAKGPVVLDDKKGILGALNIFADQDTVRERNWKQLRKFKVTSITQYPFERKYLNFDSNKSFRAKVKQNLQAFGRKGLKQDENRPIDMPDEVLGDVRQAYRSMTDKEKLAFKAFNKRRLEYLSGQTEVSQAFGRGAKVFLPNTDTSRFGEFRKKAGQENEGEFTLEWTKAVLWEVDELDRREKVNALKSKQRENTKEEK